MVRNSYLNFKLYVEIDLWLFAIIQCSTMDI